MAITFKNITLRNFLSIGAVTQAVDFDNKELTLILGENLDLGGDGARNGTGKTTLIQGLSYALFGSPINSIRKDNLINRTNSKNMMVTLEFSVNEKNYKIERGRKPNVLRLFVDDTLLKTKEDANEAQGENKETQAAIDRAIGMSLDMFKNIVALNTYATPFLSMGSGDQRKIIEQLLGITLLSEKAELIKAKIKANQESILEENFKNKAIEEANVRVREQIESLKKRQVLWSRQHASKKSELEAALSELIALDIDKELENHRLLVEWKTISEQNNRINEIKALQQTWHKKKINDLTKLQNDYTNYTSININVELETHAKLEVFLKNKSILDTLKLQFTNVKQHLDRDEVDRNSLIREIEILEQNKCHACGQDFHAENHVIVLREKQEALANLNEKIVQTQNTYEKIKNDINDLGNIGEQPVTFYRTLTEAIKHSAEVERLKTEIDNKQSEIDPYETQLNGLEIIDIGEKPTTFYDSEKAAIEHKGLISNLSEQLAIKQAEIDPYDDQITEMEKKAIQEISFDRINELTKLGDHYKFLFDVLTSKDSFVRKRILDQNLSYLNLRLSHYLDKIGLPHTVIFKNDLSVEITELGREMDFDNFSRGERNRLILGLSFAFRDVWENLYSPINTLFIDELIDSGMDTIGVENSMAILKDMSRTRNKSIWLVSHREELAGRVPQVLKVVKEGGFTTYSTTTEME